MDWLKQLVPLLGTALGGPLGGAAASFIADKLGIGEKTVEAVTDILQTTKLNDEQIAKIRLAEIDFKKFLEENKIDLERIHAADRGSARQMQISTNSRVPGLLATIIVTGFFGILIAMMYGVLHVNDQQSLLILLGALSAGFGAVLNFYFGSSHGSMVKSELLANSTPSK